MSIALKRAVTSTNILAIVVAAAAALQATQVGAARESHSPAAWEYVAVFLLYAGVATLPFVLVLGFLEEPGGETARGLLTALLLGYAVLGGGYLYAHFTGRVLPLGPLDRAVVGLSPIAVLSSIYLIFVREA